MKRETLIFLLVFWYKNPVEMYDNYSDEELMNEFVAITQRLGGDY